jgi:hypothetical protein
VQRRDWRGHSCRRPPSEALTGRSSILGRVVLRDAIVVDVRVQAFHEVLRGLEVGAAWLVTSAHLVCT